MLSLESDQARLVLEAAEERGFVEPAELEALALEHDLAEEEVEQLTRELEAIGLEVGQSKAEEERADHSVTDRVASPVVALASFGPSAASV